MVDRKKKYRIEECDGLRKGKKFCGQPNERSESGAIALVSVLVVSAVIFAVALSISIIGIGAIDVSRAAGESLKAFSAAEACLDEAALHLIRDDAWLGTGAGGALAVGDGSCSIWIRGGGSARTIIAAGVVRDAIRSVQAEFDLDSRTLTEWKEPADSIPPPINEADIVVADASQAFLLGGQKKLEGITLENIGFSDVMIDTITVAWDNSNLIEEIRIDKKKVWSWTKKGPGAPQGKQPSGTEIDIQDFRLVVGSGVKKIDRLKFNNDMTGATFSILFSMADGSTKTISNIQP